MKTVAAAVLLIALAGNTALSVADSGDSSYISKNSLSDSSSNKVAVKAESMNTSAQDLSIFGVISLGVIGLFWIRRHTSEL